MKKLVLLVSVFLLLTGMVFADVTFAPAVTGDASVTWGLDLMPNGRDYEKVNSGFTAANNSTFDLGVTIDPFDAMTGEDGMYGEIELTGMGVTAKSGSDVAVTAPTVTAKLYFMESLYMRVCTNPAPEYDVVTPLGNLITIDDNKQEGTWYDSDDGDLGTTVEADYGNAGYGFTYMMDALTVNADFVSQDDWGKDDLKTDFDLEDWDADEDGYLTQADLATLEAAVDAAATAAGAADNYDVYAEAVSFDGGVTTMWKVTTNDDDEIMLLETESDDDVALVYDIIGGADIESSLYTLGLDVTYEMDGIGTFMAYVLPKHQNSWNTFSAWGYGGTVEITAVEDYVTPMFAVDVMYDETQGFIGNDKRNILEWEAMVSLPVSYEVSEDMSFDATVKMAATDVSSDSVDGIDYDGYFAGGADVMGADLDAAYMISEMFDYNQMSASLTLDAAYPVEAMGGTVTPSAGWAVDYGMTHTPGDEEGYLTVAVAAEIVENTTFTLKYASGDLLEKQNDASDSHDPGVITFETKIAY